jgi:ferritin-like metal-binding protein YciE
MRSLLMAARGHSPSSSAMTRRPDWLRQRLEEKSAADKKLTQIATDRVNQSALAAKAD